MSSKSDSAQKIKSGTSITLRLAVFYTLTTLGILFASSALLYWMLSSSFTHASTRFLTNEAQAITNVLRGHVNDWSALNQEIIWKPQAQGNHYYARVKTKEGQVVRETFGLDDILLSGIEWPEVTEMNNAVSDVKVVQAENDQYYMLLSKWVLLKNQKQQAFMVQVALNVSHDQQLLWLYRQNLAMVTVIGTLIALLVSLFMSKLGLRPLRRLARSVASISASDLHTRLPVDRTAKELFNLVLAFNMALDRIENAFNQLSAFSSDIAHEIRTPINNLVGETEVMLQRPRTAEDYQAVLVSNLEEYHHLSRIVDRLLFLARADNNNVKLTKEPLVLNEEVQKVIEFLEAYAEEKSIAVHLHGEAVVEADPTLLRNAVSNLITNAIKYIQASGQIDVTLSTNEDDWINIEIKDNGPGIAAEHLQHIFDRFYRVESDRAKQTGGSGLGLAIVKSIVDLHGGYIEIQSETGVGTRIIITLPRK